MKLKDFKGFLNESLDEKGPSNPACSTSFCQEVMPSLNKISEFAVKFSGTATAQVLVNIQTELNKLQKLVSDTLRSSRTENTDELDWDQAPKAPIFVLNLKDRYPQTEQKYYELWYKAANRLPSFNYGGAIQIFKTYCKRENLLLEDHDYDNELSEEQIENIIKK